MKNVHREIDRIWDVRVRANGVLRYIGIFEKLEDAKKAADEAANRLGGQPFIRYMPKGMGTY
jgi:hypothetical protein